MNAKKNATPKELATILINASLSVSLLQFKDIAAYALQDNSPDEVQAVAAHMPLHLQRLMPVRYLH